MITLYEAAERYIGIEELGTQADHPLIQWWLSLCGFGHNASDEVPWCSAFLNGMCWQLRLPRTKSAMARSWLSLGTAVDLHDAHKGDVVILKRGAEPQPGPDVLNAPGHVGLYSGMVPGTIFLLAGNQGNQVSVAGFDVGRILGVRRII